MFYYIYGITILFEENKSDSYYDFLDNAIKILKPDLDSSYLKDYDFLEKILKDEFEIELTGFNQSDECTIGLVINRYYSFFSNEPFILSSITEDQENKLKEVFNRIEPNEELKYIIHLDD